MRALEYALDWPKYGDVGRAIEIVEFLNEHKFIIELTATIETRLSQKRRGSFQEH
jgi:hypothetical protein